MTAPFRVIGVWRDDVAMSAAELAAMHADAAARAGAIPATPWLEISVEPDPAHPGVSVHTFECRAARVETAAPSDLAASAPDRAVDVASTTNPPRSDGAG